MTELTPQEINDTFDLIREHADPSVHAMIDSVERLYQIERAATALAEVRLMHAQAALEVVYGSNTEHSRRASDSWAV